VRSQTEIGAQVTPPPSQKREGHKNKLVSTVKETTYRKSFKSLSDREQQRRINKISAHIIFSCSNKQDIKKDGSSYFVQSHALKIECMNFIDSIVFCIERELHVSFEQLRQENGNTIVSDSEDEDNQEIKTTPEIAMKIWNNTSQDGYRIIWNTFISQDSSCNLFPSITEIKNKRPKVVGFTVDDNSNSTDVGFDGEVNLDECSLEINGTVDRMDKGKDVIRYAARLDGGCDTYYKTLIEKQRSHNVTLKSATLLGWVDSFDGAQFLVSDEGVTVVTSFNSLLFSRPTMELGMTNDQSSIILTWKQVIGKEECSTLFSALGSHYKEKICFL